MSIDYDHLRRLVAEMEQGVSSTTKYSWLDLAHEVLRLQHKTDSMLNDVHNLRMEMNWFMEKHND
uniref:Uncharacterized protein n=1 Tax=Actinobacteria phage HS02 TaxID=3056388 RepID=A0AA49X1Y4_9VIRU|nr:MAG: hypothetical protein [Actinobacteria phage HS02]